MAPHVGMRRPSYDVVIIGAGPGGLTAAHAIHAAAPDLTVAVLERNPLLQRRGAGLGLEYNGLKCLRAINPDLCKAALATASRVTHMNKLRADGTLVSSSAMADELSKFDPEGAFKMPCLLGWYELQQLLLDALPPSVDLQLGAEFERYEEVAPDSVVVHCAPRCGVPPAAASLLVAADGFFSRVRQQAVGDGPPTYCNTMMWRARLPATPDMLRLAGDQQQGQAFSMVMDTGRLWVVYPVGNADEMVWTVSATDDRLQAVGINPHELLPRLRPQKGDSSGKAEQGDAATGIDTAAAADVDSDAAAVDTQGFTSQTLARGEASKARCLKVLQEGFAPALLDVVANTPAQQVVEHGLFVRMADTVSPASFGKGRVVVLGDAAHPVRPTGQGLNSSLEDCYELGVALAGAARGADVAVSSLDAFRARRAARMAPVVSYAWRTGTAAYKQSSKDTGSKDTGDDAAAGAASKDQEALHYMTQEQFLEHVHSKEWAPLRALVPAPAVA